MGHVGRKERGGNTGAGWYGASRGRNGEGRGRQEGESYGCGRQTVESRHDGLSGAGAGAADVAGVAKEGTGTQVSTTPTGPESRDSRAEKGKTG